MEDGVDLDKWRTIKELGWQPVDDLPGRTSQKESPALDALKELRRRRGPEIFNDGAVAKVLTEALETRHRAHWEKDTPARFFRKEALASGARICAGDMGDVVELIMRPRMTLAKFVFDKMGSPLGILRSAVTKESGHATCMSCEADVTRLWIVKYEADEPLVKDLFVRVGRRMMAMEAATTDNDLMKAISEEKKTRRQARKSDEVEEEGTEKKFYPPKPVITLGNIGQQPLSPDARITRTVSKRQSLESDTAKAAAMPTTPEDRRRREARAHAELCLQQEGVRVCFCCARQAKPSAYQGGGDGWPRGTKPAMIQAFNHMLALVNSETDSLPGLGRSNQYTPDIFSRNSSEKALLERGLHLEDGKIGRVITVIPPIGDAQAKVYVRIDEAKKSKPKDEIGLGDCQELTFEEATTKSRHLRMG